MRREEGVEVRMSVVIQDIHNKHITYIHTRTHARTCEHVAHHSAENDRRRQVLHAVSPPSCGGVLRGGHGRQGRPDAVSHAAEGIRHLCGRVEREVCFSVSSTSYACPATDDLLLCVCYPLGCHEVPKPFPCILADDRRSIGIFSDWTSFQVTSGGSAVP